MTSQWRFDKQQFILFINYHQINYGSFKAIAGCPRVHLPAGRRASVQIAQCIELAAGRLSRFHPKRPVVFKFAEYKQPSALQRVSPLLEDYRKLKTETKTIAELKEALQVIWGNLPQGPIDKAVKDLSNKATGGWCCTLELSVNTLNIYSDNGIWHLIIS